MEEGGPPAADEAMQDVCEPATAAEVGGAAPAVGSEVFAFYHANSNREGFRYVHTTSQAAPLTGLSAGWLPGTVLAGGATVGEVAHVLVRFRGLFSDPYQGLADGLQMQVPQKLVLLRESTPEGLVPVSAPQPLLSLLCVRWWDYWSSRWASDYNITSDQMLTGTFDGSCGPSEALPGQHEVHTVFVRRSEDLAAVSEQWASVALRGQHRVAWYFLWPTAMLPGAGTRPGCVNERDFFALAQRMERAGIRSGWPHPSLLYRSLCGKLWVAQMCLMREYRVPPTTRVHFQEFATSPADTARAAVERLRTLRREIWGDEPEEADVLRGVVKLGFSWQGKDVKPFTGARALQDALGELLGQARSQQLVCLVQQMVPGVVCELRALVFRDAVNDSFVWQKVYMALWDKNDKHHGSTDEFAMTSGKVVLPEEAPAAFFGGDTAAPAHAEREVDTLVRCWLRWFAAECGQGLSMTRLDFLVAQAGPGQLPSVWTCEVTECGSSLCDLEVSARNAAALNFALLHERSGACGFPRPLPPLRFRGARW